MDSETVRSPFSADPLPAHGGGAARGRHSGEVRALRFAPRPAHPADRTRSITRGLPQHTPAIDSHPMAAVWHAAVAEVSAPRPTPQWGMLTALLKPAPSYHPYPCIENLVCDTPQVFIDLRDTRSLHGQRHFNIDCDSCGGYSGCTCPRYFSDKFDLEFIDLRHQPGPSFLPYQGA